MVVQRHYGRVVRTNATLGARGKGQGAKHMKGAAVIAQRNAQKKERIRTGAWPEVVNKKRIHFLSSAHGDISLVFSLVLSLVFSLVLSLVFSPRLVTRLFTRLVTRLFTRLTQLV